ncbi:MAG TPA: T9SS type A sorting domain-containing protein, partial [bacterium]|nr:T9SS type A sorting domain-containing protein [bacterium]
NPSPEPVRLLGWSLTDRADDPRRWGFPDQILEAGSYLIVFASGKDRSVPNGELHTSFSLNRAGEYLALLDPDGRSVTVFDPAFPEQSPDISYAWFDGDYLHTESPTPGSENILSGDEPLPAPSLSHGRGFYETPFRLTLSTGLTHAEIRYTTDGSEPDEGSGRLYAGPVEIAATTVLRARTIKPGLASGKIVTSTYLFPGDVVRQPNDPPGYPAQWGAYVELPGHAIADYEMDPEITEDPRYAPLMKESLLAIPTLSIVTDRDNLFSHGTDPEKGGIYIHTGAPGAGDVPLTGRGWERPASVEFFDRDGREFQVDCGLRIHGGHSRRPEKSPKHSFRLHFRKIYDHSRLTFPLFGEDGAASFNGIVLRAGYGNSWLHFSSGERLRHQMIRDVWAKDTQRDMGQPGGRGTYVHLYLNGLYWGIYNPTERIDDDYAASRFGGDKADYDVIKDYGEAAAGDRTAWNALISLAGQDMTSDANFMRLLGKNPDGTHNPGYPAYLDLENFMDYLIMNLYGANWDWDHHNWIAVRNRVQPGTGFQFFSWDAEHVLRSVSENSVAVNNAGRPTGLFHRLRRNAGFRRMFADRVQRHCFNGGALTPEAASERWMKRAREIETAVIAESARWGDYRRDVHLWSSGPFELYTKAHWLDHQAYLLDTYFPERTDAFIGQLRRAGLFPAVDAPRFLINSRSIADPIIRAGDRFSVYPATGTIYYTVDGSDPRTDAGVHTSAIEYTAGFRLDQSTHIRARRIEGQIWSALSERVLIVREDMQNLKVTEIHYHPLAEDGIDHRALEFIELKNTGSAPLDLGGVRFVRGITYTFPPNTILHAQAFIVLASDMAQFSSRYGLVPFGRYEGNLDNGGERIVLVSASGDTLFSVRYDNRDPWPGEAAGQGRSLVPVEFNPSGDQSDPASWRASLLLHGSPGKDDDGRAGVGVAEDALPPDYHLAQNYPNPFNASTVISFAIPRKSRVRIEVFDALGRRVALLNDGSLPAGRYRSAWDAGSSASGLYVYRLTAQTADGSTFSRAGKMMLLR